MIRIIPTEIFFQDWVGYEGTKRDTSGLITGFRVSNVNQKKMQNFTFAVCFLHASDVTRNMAASLAFQFSSLFA